MRRTLRGASLDRLVAVTLLVAAEVVLFAGNATPGLAKGLGAVLAIAITLPVAVRRRLPLAVGVVVVTSFSTILLVGAHNYSPPLTIAWMCALYGVAVWTDTRAFLAGLAVFVAATLLATLGTSTTFGDGVYFAVIPGVVMVIVRRAVRERQLQAEALAARAQLLEREQRELTTQAIAEERARIARELHDLVAHNVSVMVVQAGAERHALPAEQSSTRETLSSIEQAGRQALAEARRLLGILRQGTEQESLEPQPSLDAIDLLLEQVKRAGLEVTFAVAGERRPLPAGVDLCAYRIVQESLTNALKHARPARAHVMLGYEPGSLRVEVSDDGSEASAPNGDGAGHGLIGMRERVALYGGHLDAGPRAGGGFLVRAVLPLA